MTTDAFHPAVARWFDGAFPGPTEAQAAAWPAIMAGRNTLVAAPTEEVQALISGVTWPELKAPRIQAVLRAIGPNGENPVV